MRAPALKAMLVLIPVSFALASTSSALEMPKIPLSSRPLTAKEVRNYWINTFNAMEDPGEPSGLYPSKVAAYKNRMRNRRNAIKAIEAGDFDLSSRIAAMEHNVEYYFSRGLSEEAIETENNLLDLKRQITHQKLMEADLRLKKVQIEKEEKLIEALDKVERCDSPDDDLIRTLERIERNTRN